MRQYAQYSVALDLNLQVCIQTVMWADRFAALQLPSPCAVAERLRRKGADRTHVDHIAGEFRIYGITNERKNLGMLATAAHAEFHDASDFLPKTNAARAMDTTAHFLGTYEGPKIFMEDDTLFFFVARTRFTVSNGQILQLTFTALVANWAVQRMVDQQELHHALLRLFGLLGGRKDFHALCNGSRAGWQWLRCFFNLH